MNRGALITTPFGFRSTAGEVAAGIDLSGKRVLVTGAASGIGLVTEGIGGRYFVDCNEAEPVAQRTQYMGGVAPYALDPGNAGRLWEASLRMMNGVGADGGAGPGPGARPLSRIHLHYPLSPTGFRRRICGLRLSWTNRRSLGTSSRS